MLPNNFFQFIADTTKENFEFAQQFIMNHNDYDPYSDDLDQMDKLLEAGKLEETLSFNTINSILSPRAHINKSYALDQLDNQQDANSEIILAQKIMEGISLTGYGTKEAPYVVTRITDEQDFLMFKQERFKSQQLVRNNDRIMDLITCQSGTAYYFDITVPYQRMQSLMGIPNSNTNEAPKQRETKKWWQFWK